VRPLRLRSKQHDAVLVAELFSDYSQHPTHRSPGRVLTATE
jgi:hypothetical protein